MKSHPSWVCGLKQVSGGEMLEAIKSHPSWVCGLKPSKSSKNAACHCVTPFVGVWIETVNLTPISYIF